MINLIHDIDLMRFVLGDIDEIKGFGAATTRAQGRVETGALALRFAWDYVVCHLLGCRA